MIISLSFSYPNRHRDVERWYFREHLGMKVKDSMLCLTVALTNQPLTWRRGKQKLERKCCDLPRVPIYNVRPNIGLKPNTSTRVLFRVYGQSRTTRHINKRRKQSLYPVRENFMAAYECPPLKASVSETWAWRDPERERERKRRLGR